MRTFYQFGAMYAKIEEDDQIDTSPVELGDGILHPGEWVGKIGEKVRTSFEMNKGYYLRYVGSGMEGNHRVLLFAVKERPLGPSDPAASAVRDRGSGENS